MAAWQSGTLYNPGDIVSPSTASGITRTPPTNASFASGDTGWTKGTGWTIVNTGGYDNIWSSRYSNSPATGNIVNNFRAPVVPGLVITANCLINHSNDSSNAVGRISIFWYDSGNVFLSQSDGADVGNTFGAWFPTSVTATAPASAAFASVVGVGNMYAGVGLDPIRMDAFTWDYAYAAVSLALVYQATQANAGFSGTVEPTWPTSLAGTVVDNQVTWTAVLTSRVTWQATPIMKSSSSEPTWPSVVGAVVTDGSVLWEATARQVTDAKCPQSKYVTIAASKIFAGDDDIIAFSATTNPLDWSTADDAGYLPFGLQTHGSNPVAALGLYRSNLVAFNTEGFQMWQVDQDPANMAFLDAVPTGSEQQGALQPLANDLIFLSAIGVRNVSIAGASTNLQADGVGEPVDPLVQAALANAENDLLALFWPATGQYWLIVDDEAFVLTINGAKTKSWSRYSFPEAVTDWTLNGSDLYLRTDENNVWRVNNTAITDDHAVTPGIDGSVAGADTVLIWDAYPATVTGYRITNAATGEVITDVGAMALTYTVPDQADGSYTYRVYAILADGTLSLPSPTLSRTVNTTSTWAAETAASVNDWRAICWAPSLGIFCAVANNGSGGGRAMTSPDGVIWTTQTAANDGWLALCWSPELSLFVATAIFGTLNRVMTSPDGVTWTVRTTPNSNAYYGVCWSAALGLFAACAASGTGNRIMTSPDGTTWTARTSAADNSWVAMCYSPELTLFVSVANSGTGNRVMTSANGILWTIRTSAEDNDWRSVCWAPELSLFVAVAATGTHRVMTSPDGIIWTARTAAAASQWDAVCWSPEQLIFVAVSLGNEGSGRVMKSPNGTAWTTSDSGPTARGWDTVCWSPELGIFCAVASGTGTATNKVIISQALSTPDSGGGAASPVTTSEPFTGTIQWPYLDCGSPGREKNMVGLDLTTDAPEGVSISIGYDQRDRTKRTADYLIDADTEPGQLIPIPVSAPSFDLKLTFEPAQAWEFFTANLYF